MMPREKFEQYYSTCRTLPDLWAQFYSRFICDAEHKSAIAEDFAELMTQNYFDNDAVAYVIGMPRTAKTEAVFTALEDACWKYIVDRFDAGVRADFECIAEQNDLATARLDDGAYVRSETETAWRIANELLTKYL